MLHNNWGDRRNTDNGVRRVVAIGSRISRVSVRNTPIDTCAAMLNIQHIKITLASAAVLFVVACATTPAPGAVAARVAPLVDYHQHLISPAFAPIVKGPHRDGSALLKELDAAGIERAVVLSVGYSFADERKGLTDPDRLTREENDWTSAEVARNGRRLIGFCSANPLRPAALQELERCLALPGMIGIKLHFGNAGISLRDTSHLRRMQEVF